LRVAGHREGHRVSGEEGVVTCWWRCGVARAALVHPGLESWLGSAAESSEWRRAGELGERCKGGAGFYCRGGLLY